MCEGLVDMKTHVQEKLYYIVCVSIADGIFSEENLSDLIKNYRRHCESHDLTGMLVYDEGAFIQIAEGIQHNVNDFYDKIYDDAVHEEMLKIAEGPLDERNFVVWDAGYRTTENLREINLEGFRKLVASGGLTDQSVPSRDVKDPFLFLNAFRDVITEN